MTPWLWLIDWLGLNAIFNNFSVISWRPVHLLMCFLAFSHQYSTQHRLGNRRMMLVTVTFVKRRKECWPSWDPCFETNQFCWLPTFLISFVKWGNNTNYGKKSLECRLFLPPINVVCELSFSEEEPQNNKVKVVLADLCLVACLNWSAINTIQKQESVEVLQEPGQSA